MKYNKGFAPVLILVIVLGALAVGGVAYFAGKSPTPKNEVSDNSNYFPVEQNSNPPTTYNNNLPSNNQSQQQTNTQIPPASPQANWKTVSGSYKSTNYQVKLPSDFKEKSVQANSEWHSKSFENSTYNFYILVEPIARLSSFSENLSPRSLAQVANALKNRNTYGSVIAQKEIKVAGVQALLQDGYSLADSGGFVHLSTILLSGDNFIVLTLSSKQNDWAKVKDADFVRGRLTQDFRGFNNQILSTFKFISPSVTINNELEARLLKYKNLSSKQLAVQITAEEGVVTLINIPWRP